MPRNNIYFNEEKTKGRPRLVLNEEGQKAIRNLSQYQCTYEEIASFLDIKLDTLLAPHNRATFMECVKKGSEQGKASLRRMQFELAKKNSTMAIWLGKNFLGQRDDFIATIKGDKDEQSSIKIELIGGDTTTNPRETKNDNENTIP